MSFLTIFRQLLVLRPQRAQIPTRAPPLHPAGDFRPLGPLVSPLQKFLQAPMGAHIFSDRARFRVYPALCEDVNYYFDECIVTQ